MRHKFACFSLLIMLTFIAYGQYDIRKVARVKGISSGTITAMDQDHQGLIWVGTRDGLKRYDGQEVKSYKPQSSSLVGNDVSAVLVDAHNRLWVGTTDGGLNLYVHEVDSFNHFMPKTGVADAIESTDVRDILEDGQGNIWVATKHGLNRYIEDGNSFEVFRSPFANQLIRDIEIDDQGNIWCGTFGGGLYQFNPETKKFKDFLTELTSAPKVQSLAIVNDQILIGTRDQGVLLFDPESNDLQSFLTDDKYKESSNIWDILVSDDGKKIWIGTDGNGMIALEAHDGEWRDQPLFIPLIESKRLGNAVYTIFFDRDENMWIGSAWKGLYALEHLHNDISFLAGLENEDQNTVWSIYKENETVWLGTDGNGLLIYDQARAGDLEKYYERYKIVTIDKRVDGNYWLGTYSNGLILFGKDKRELKRYGAKAGSLPANDVRDILHDPKSNGYWIGTWGGGISFIDERTQEFTTFQYDANDETTLSNNNVVALEYASGGKIWVATFGGGVNRFDPETRTFERYQYQVSRDYGTKFLSKNLTCIYDDQLGNLWFGTWTKGLSKLNLATGDVHTFEHYPFLQGVTVCSILEDSKRNVWISTTEGIYKYVHAQDTVLDYSDLKGGYHFGSAFQDQQGHMYFGGLNGVVSFDPLKMEIVQKEPNIVFTDFKLFNKSVTVGKGQFLDKTINHQEKIELTYDQRVITFDFAALKYPFSDECEYGIKMENFDGDWRNNGANRSATYTNLDPGEYIFRVKTYDKKGELSENEASVKVLVGKPYWATWWAYTFYVLLFGVLLYFYRKYNIYWEKMKNQLKLEQLGREKEAELHEIKVRFFTNISHEIRTPVTLILGSINRLMESGITDKANLSAVQNIRKNGSHLLNLVSELLDFRKLESGDARLKAAEGNIVNFLKEISLSFTEQAINKSIAYDFHTDLQEIKLWYDRDEMEKVLYNLISNAFKYTPEGGKVFIGISQDDQFVYIKIEDTGKGIPAKQLKDIFKRFYQSDNDPTYKNNDGYGLGLSITYEIIKLHGGEIIAESELGKGSAFTIKLPLGNTHLKSEFLIEDFKDSEEVALYASNSEGQGENVKLSFPDQSELTVLVAEDNDGIRAYLYDLLNEHFHVILAVNGREALELTYEKMPDLILSDVMMPEMDGITFSGKVKQDPRISHIPIIILTARTSLIFKKEGLDIGVDDYITKPFSEIILKTRIRNLLNNRHLLREKYKTDLLIEPSELALRSPDQEFLSSLSDIIEANMSSGELSAEHLCKEMGMSQSNVYKKLKSLTGMSIVEFVRDFRLKHAVQLIVRQKLTVSEACYKVGFNDRRYFSQVFKTKYGMTPTQYAKTHHEDS
ncbi:two-component regulator propeller domain-containing protein [Marinoscillum furvescens]|uniref:histidine kinase n=1 Tax=Marinoscillum furvescens DSM 4134 TaxID=1122208 RepID=A0A3D9LJS0_MARFU|nr:two-component regulator propeller domain-containing protein [Marinoscillum furvescens]REE05502.1 hypothetical protein C7460_10117 [Marinoscillum furvescens DSM 4134]